MTSIEQWRSDLGLGQYAERFIGADIDREVLECLDDAADRIGRSGEQLFLPVVHLTRGRLFAQAGDRANAEAAFRAALRVGNAQGAKALEARAAAELACPDRHGGRPNAA